MFFYFMNEGRKYTLRPAALALFPQIESIALEKLSHLQIVHKLAWGF